MEKKNNSAGRLWRILGQIGETDVNTQMITIWKRVLYINDVNKNKLPFEIARKIDLLRDELIEARQKMQEKHYSEDLYAIGLKSAGHILQIEAIHSQLSNYRNDVSPEVIKALKFVAETIPDEEDEVTPEQLGELQANINELIGKVNNGNLPDRVKEFIYRQVEIIENAIRDYNIIGAKAFKTAFDSGLADIAINKEDIAEYAETEEVRTWGKIWKKAIQYGGSAFKYGSYAKTAVEMIDTVVKIAGYLKP
jgi:hypothetical protein